MREFIELHPSLIYLVIGIIFFMAGDFTFPAIIVAVFILGKLEKTVLYSNIVRKLQKHLSY